MATLHTKQFFLQLSMRVYIFKTDSTWLDGPLAQNRFKLFLINDKKNAIMVPSVSPMKPFSIISLSI